MSNPPQRPPVYPPPGTEQATQPLPPVREPAAYRADPYAADPRPAYWRLEGIRTGLTIVGLLALIAIGLAVWALIRADHNRRVTTVRPGTNVAALTTLTNRVDRLQSTVQSLSSSHGSGTAGTQAGTQALKSQISALQQSQKQLQATQKQLSAQIGHSHSTGNSAQVTQLASKEAALSAKVTQLVGKEAALSGQVGQLQGRVSSLNGQVGQLRSQLGNQSTTTVTTGTTGTSTGP